MKFDAKIMKERLEDGGHLYFSERAELVAFVVAHCTETVRSVGREENSGMSWELMGELQTRMMECFGIKDFN